MIVDARVRHHVRLGKVRRAQIVQFLLGDVTVQIVPHPLLDVRLPHEPPVEAVLVQAPNNAVVGVLSQLDADLYALVGFNEQLAADDPRLAIDAARFFEIDVTLFDQGFAQSVGHVRHVLRPKHLTVVGADP